MTTMQERRAAVLAARSRVERRKGERDTLESRRATLENALAASRERTETITQAGVLLKEAAVYARQRAAEQVQGLTSSALQSVFGAGYEFALQTGDVGDRPVVTCQVRSPYRMVEAEVLRGANIPFTVDATPTSDYITTEGIESRGGGIVDIQALALRWAMLETHRPLIDGPLLLDEPAKHVSEENVPAAGAFLKSSCTQFGRQVIMVTHNPQLTGLADRVIEIQMRDGQSRVVA